MFKLEKFSPEMFHQHVPMERWKGTENARQETTDIIADADLTFHM